MAIPPPKTTEGIARSRAGGWKEGDKTRPGDRRGQEGRSRGGRGEARKVRRANAAVLNTERWAGAGEQVWEGGREGETKRRGEGGTSAM